MKVNIKKLEKDDFYSIWPLFKEIVSTTDTFIYEAKTSQSEAKANLFQENSVVYAAFDDTKQALAWYRLRPNQIGKGSHVANASFMVSPKHQKQGLGKLLGLSALQEAKKKGYKAMQFNMVVSHNRSSLRLWLRLGFRILARLPKAYKHSTLGYIDSFVMHKSLD